MKKTIFFLLIAFIIGFLSSFAFNKLSITGEVIEDIPDDYTYTRAICNENNECIDVLVSCKAGRVSSLEPISDIKEFAQPRNLDTGDFCN